MNIAITLALLANVIWDVRDRFENILRELGILNPVCDDSDSDSDDETPMGMYS